jgi:hypothetical protein
MRQSGALASRYVAFFIDFRYTKECNLHDALPEAVFLIKGVLSATGDMDVTGGIEKIPKTRQKE